MAYRIPVATYRFQFNAQFTFPQARALVSYLRRLGISDLYSSPLLRPRAGSAHGYDIVDPDSINPELGTEDDLTELSGELDRHDMGMILDIVPNHLAASHENAWWVSVLENGRQSRYAHFFDIDWRPVPGRDPKEERLLLPVLGKPYGETLESGEILLDYDEKGFFFRYYEHRFPLCPGSYPLVLRHCADALPAEGAGLELRDLVQSQDPIANSRFLKETLWRLHEQSPEFRSALRQALEELNGRGQESLNRLDVLLEAQWYRLAYWRMASETINYRRFFDVTDLVGVRVENPEVFELRNRRILELIGEGTVTGLRIDHIDGLFDPVSYLTRLQLRLGDPQTPGNDRFYVVVEKILAGGERLPASFRCDGTTGYDFLDTASAVMVDPAGLDSLTEFYRAVTGMTAPFADVVYERKKQVIDQLFFGEMRALGSHLAALAVCDRNARDFAPSELLAALTEITACLPVYRSYVREAPASGADRDVLRRAVAEARRRAPQVDARLFHFLELVLLVEPPEYIQSEREKWLQFVMRWQQFTGRVTAKGVEDTAFYNYNRLISLNEVGGEPGREGSFDPVRELHERNERTARHWPHTMNATSTHDTKRSEDVRARIAVLSEVAEAWQRQVRRWMRINAPLKKNGVPHPNEELLVYQTLVGMWPLAEPEEAAVPDRLAAFLEKAAREAKTHSSWLAPDGGYESALKEFAAAVVGHEPFRAAFLPFQRMVAFHGFLNSLAQVVLKVCSPGVPDFYQGSELWDFSLVDPDNRRPVDYERRIAAIDRFASPAALLRGWRDGRVKLFVTARSLEVRARRIDSFRGSYTALDTGSESAVAFLRGEDVLAVVPRLTSRLVRPPRLPVGEVWGGLSLPVSGRWRNAFTGEVVESGLLRELLGRFPVGVFERE